MQCINQSVSSDLHLTSGVHWQHNISQSRYPVNYAQLQHQPLTAC